MQMIARIIRCANVRRWDAHFAHCVYLYATIDRAHSRIWYWVEMFAQHRFIVSLCSLWLSRCLSSILFHRLSPLGGKKNPPPRAFGTVFLPLHFSPSILPPRSFVFLSLSFTPSLPPSLCVSILFPVTMSNETKKGRKRVRKRERGERGSNSPMHLADSP